MRSFAPSLFGAFLGSLLAFGCASPQTQSPTGSGSAGTTGGGNTSGTAGTTGGGNTSGTAGTTGSACVAMPTQLVNANAWNCDLSDPIAIQGAIYGYSDGSSCASPQPADICTASAGCCISGTTVVDATSAKWGCGIGMELDSSGGTAPVKSQYTGSVKCFDITLTGSSGGNVVRIGFTQSANSTTVAPFSEIAAFTSGWHGPVCFTDAECPSWATAAQCSKAVGTMGTPYDMQIQVSAGATTASVGTYNVCVSSIVPVGATGGTGGTGGGTSSCTSVTGAGTISAQYGTAHVSCSGKDYIVQNNDWGVTTASQTITYGTGTKFKVATQNGTGAGNNPASFPSIFTGANANNSTAGSGLPRAVSSIAKGSLSTSWTWASNGASGSYNAAYDVWFSTSSGGDPSASFPSGGFLMVWYEKPTANQPIGASVASTTIDGKNWNVWYGTNSGNSKPCVSYVAQQTINSMTYSLGDFIQDAVTRGYLQSSWYLTNVFAGYEIWNGGVGLETTDFSVTVP
jgi:Glycosyl hydrolase family 12